MAGFRIKERVATTRGMVMQNSQEEIVEAQRQILARVVQYPEKVATLYDQEIVRVALSDCAITFRAMKPEELPPLEDTK
jgi:hypothetical protein